MSWEQLHVHSKSSNYLLDQPLSIFAVLENASYQNSKEEAFTQLPSHLREHEFVCLDREVVEGYPIVLCSYKDTAKKIHHAVAIKGLIAGGAFGENVVQCLGAASRALSPERDVLPQKIQNLLVNWKEEFQFDRIDTVVGHSAGARVVNIVADCLKRESVDFRGVIFNGQVNPTHPNVLHLCTDNDWLNAFSTDCRRVGPGGHGLRDFDRYGAQTLGQVIGEEIRREEIREEAPILEKRFEGSEVLRKEDLEKARSFLTKLQREKETLLRRQRAEEAVVTGAQIGSALANGFAHWQQRERESIQSAAYAGAAQAAQALAEELQGRQRSSGESHRSHEQVTRHLDMSRWAARQTKARSDALEQHLGNLEKRFNEWRSLEKKSRGEQSAADVSRKAVLEREMVHDKRLISQVLRGVSTVCDVARLGVGFFYKPAGEVIGMAGGAAAAGAAYTDRARAAEEIARQKEAGILEAEAARWSANAEIANQRADFHEGAYQASLERLATDRTIDPSFRREALGKKVAYWKSKLQEHETREPKKEEKQTADRRAWEENQAALREAVAEAKKTKKEANRVASIEDRGYRVVQKWSNFWSSSDAQTAAFSEALHREIQRYSEATQEESHALYNTFSAFEQLASFHGSRKAGRAIHIGRDAYSMFDLLRYTKTTAFPNLLEARKGPGAWLENVGGLPKLLDGYLVPGLQFAICGYRILQMLSEGELPEDEAVVRARQLQHIDQQLAVVQRGIGEMMQEQRFQRGELRQGFDRTLESIGALREKITSRLDKFASEISEKIDRTDFEHSTAEREKRAMTLGAKLSCAADKHAFLFAKAEEAEKSFSSGVRDRATPLQAPDYLPLVFEEPWHHTGLLRSLIEGNNLPCPNLRQYLAIVGRFVVDLMGRAEAEPLKRKLLMQGHDLTGLMNGFDRACEQAAEAQTTLLHKVGARTEKSLREEREGRLAEVVAQASGLRRGESAFLQGFAGESRYGLTKTFRNNDYPFLHPPASATVVRRAEGHYTPKWDAVAGGMKEAGVDFAEDLVDCSVHLIVVPRMMIGLRSPEKAESRVRAGMEAAPGPMKPLVAPLKFVGIPVIILGSLAWNTAGAVANGPKRMWCNREWRSLLSTEHSILSRLSQRGFGTTGGGKEQHVRWHLAVADRVGSVFLGAVSFRAQDDQPFRRVYSSTIPTPFHELVTLKCMESTPGQYYLEREVDPKILTAAEIAQLPSFQIVSRHKELARAYLEAAATQKPRGKFDEEFFANAEWIPASEPGLVPLAFPKSLLAPFDIEKRRLAAKGISFTPKYVLEEKHGVWELSLEFFAAGRPHSSVVVATFDEKTVKTFSPPVFDGQSIQHGMLNKNEFLISAMYASYNAGVGFPGQGSVNLAARNLIAPVDQPFSGLFVLLGKHKGMRLDYDMTSYAGDDQISAHPYESIRYRKDHGAPDLLRPPLDEEEYAEYATRYHILKAMLALKLGIEHNHDEVLHDAGLCLPPAGGVETVYTEIGVSPDIVTLADKPVKDLLSDLQTSYPISRYFRGVLGAIGKLDPKAKEEDFVSGAAASQAEE